MSGQCAPGVPANRQWLAQSITLRHPVADETRSNIASRTVIDVWDEEPRITVMAYYKT